MTRPARFALTCAAFSAAVVYAAGRLPVWVERWDGWMADYGTEDEG